MLGSAQIMRSGDFADFRQKLTVGDDAPDGLVVDAATGAEIQLSTLWRTQHVVIEFGSMT